MTSQQGLTTHVDVIFPNLRGLLHPAGREHEDGEQSCGRDGNRLRQPQARHDEDDVGAAELLEMEKDEWQM